MGNSSSREGSGTGAPTSSSQQAAAAGTPSPTERQHPHTVYSSRLPGRSRPDLSFLGIGTTSNVENAPERRETKQERERRKLEKERIARVKERERSLKEEHVDGGYLVTMGVYTGVEDFNKGVVRQLMIERRIAPFWRGLDDFREDWTEHQLVAAGRGLPIPDADEIPEDEPARTGESPDNLNQNVHNLMVPINSRSLSAGSNTSTHLSPSHPAFSGSPSVGPTSAPSSSPFRPRSKTLASLTTSSRNPSSTDLVPRESQLPKDPFVNGQSIEVFLYKDASECPICFLYYPPYLNKTRCCDQPICSECFVQIKRPDPHPPEHEHPDPSNPTPPPAETDVDPESLVSEPATCPYCQQSEFGVTYDPPNFRRGLTYANGGHGLGSFSSAMSSSSSLNSAASPTTLPPHQHKRRTTSISANASTVVTTDKVRPDWATKLANARNHLARRSAAATALHTAAYLIGSGSTDQRSFGFGGRSRFGRNRGESSPGTTSGAVTPSASDSTRNLSEQAAEIRRETQAAGGRRRGRMDDLEDMMMMEAIRLSLAAEEDRKRRAEKEAAKDAKKRLKEEKKREKKEKKVYGSGQSSASGSALSLSLPGIGRRRGNSGGSNLQNQVTPENVNPNSKGKGVDRGPSNVTSSPIDFPRAGSSTAHGFPGAKHLDTTTFGNFPDSNQTSPSPTAPEKPSHLRQMSNASSIASSFGDSVPGSLRNEMAHGSSSTMNTPNASGTNLGTSDSNGASHGGSGEESLFNFRSLVAMIGKDEKEDKDDVARHIEYLGGRERAISGVKEEARTTGLEESVATLKVSDSIGNGGANVEVMEPQRTTPEVMITPETPAAVGSNEGKQLGSDWGGVAREVTQ